MAQIGELVVEPTYVPDVVADGWYFVDEGDLVTITYFRRRAGASEKVASLVLGKANFIAAVQLNVPPALAVKPAKREYAQAH
jgi:hypothetical protein